MKTKQTVALVTFGLFMTEAIIHYNMGVKDVEEELQPRKKFKFEIPPTNELIKLALIVGVFSVANAYIIDAIQKRRK
tara:strand:- start:755 stop:985 length:231 start_codon:yes stop_codon:yes gene_type:complete